MDQRAERAVHDQMVEVTCKDTASQCVSRPARVLGRH